MSVADGIGTRVGAAWLASIPFFGEISDASQHRVAPHCFEQKVVAGVY
jgi:hypothetical protein